MNAILSGIKTIAMIDDDIDEFDIFKSAMQEVNPGVKLHYIDNFFVDPGPERCINPDLVFLDLNMPGINGFTWLRNLRASRHKDLPIIVYSTSAAQAMVRKAYDLGADLYAVKSSTFRDLKTSLSIILSFDWQNRKEIKNYFTSNGEYVPLYH